MTDLAAPTFDAIEVLTRSGAARERLLELLDDEAVDVDAHLVSDVLRSNGRVGEALETRRALVELCGLLRAIDATLSDQIDLGELRSGVAMHAQRTDRFAAFHDARVVLRTLDEVLEPGRIDHDPRATRAQVELLGADLRGWLLEQLTGNVGGVMQAPPDEVPTASNDPRAPYELVDPVVRREAHELVTELLHGARHHPVTGLPGAAWMRDWAAVPIHGERFGEDAAERERLASALVHLLPAGTDIVQVDRQRQQRWQVDHGTIVVGDGLRRSWQLPGTGDGIALAAIEDRYRCVLTTLDLDFAIVEADEHRVLLGPRPFVETALGIPPLEAIAAFREEADQLGPDEEAPHPLQAVAQTYGRLRRRSR